MYRRSHTHVHAMYRRSHTHVHSMYRRSHTHVHAMYRRSHTHVHAMYRRSHTHVHAMYRCSIVCMHVHTYMHIPLGVKTSQSTLFTATSTSLYQERQKHFWLKCFTCHTMSPAECQILDIAIFAVDYSSVKGAKLCSSKTFITGKYTYICPCTGICTYVCTYVQTPAVGKHVHQSTSGLTQHR